MSGDDFLPDATTLARLGELDDEGPVVMLNLLEFVPDGEAAYADYGRIALPQILKRGGQILYSGVPVFDDPTCGHWDRVILVCYPSRAAFADMLEDPEYRQGLPHRAAALERTVLYACRQAPGAPPLAPIEVSTADEILVLNLLRFKPDGGRAEYQKYGEVVLPMILERGGGPALVLTPELPLVSSETWEDLYLVRYPELASLQEMVATDTWQQANDDRQRGLDLTWAFATRPGS